MKNTFDVFLPTDVPISLTASCLVERFNSLHFRWQAKRVSLFFG